MKQELIPVGAIVNAHGIRGEVKLNPVGFDPEFLAEFDRFCIGGKETEVRSARVHKSVVLLTLPGVIVGTLLFGYFRLPGGAVGGLIAAGLAIMASVWAANALRRKAEKRKDEQAAIPVQYTEVTPEPEKPAAQERVLPTVTAANAYDRQCQTYYEGADGALYWVFAAFSPAGSDGENCPNGYRSQLIAAGEESWGPLTLYAYDAVTGKNAREAFAALVESWQVTASAQEGDACVVDAATDNYADAGALYAHEHHVTSKCTYNDIIWTLYMKNGDEITLRQVVECGEQPVQSYSWEDTALDTTEALQTLLDRLTEEVSFETAVTIYLPAVTYDQPLTIRRPVKLVAHDDGTTFASPVTVERLPENTVVDMHVVLQGCRLRGSGGTGIKAQAPTYLDHCEISGWDVGALAADGGWIWVQRSDFSRNGVALCIDTNGSSSWSSNIYGGRFIRNGTAIRLAEMPGDWMTLRVHESAFYDNDTLLDNLCGAEVAFDENCLEQTA